MSEKKFKFSVCSDSLRYGTEIVRYIDDDEQVSGMDCFETFGEAKKFAKECLEQNYQAIQQLKAKDVA